MTDNSPEAQEIFRQALKVMMIRTVVVIDPTHRLFGEVLDTCRPGAFGGGEDAITFWHSKKEAQGLQPGELTVLYARAGNVLVKRQYKIFKTEKAAVRYAAKLVKAQPLT